MSRAIKFIKDVASAFAALVLAPLFIGFILGILVFTIKLTVKFFMLYLGQGRE